MEKKEFLKDTKTRIGLLVLLGLLLIIIGLIINKGSSPKGKGEELPKEYLNTIEYSIPHNEYCSCITFLDDNKFAEYDCDSEVTNMPFTGEYFDTYHYYPEDNKLVFTGYKNKNVTAEILDWKKDGFILKVEGSNQSKKCSINNNDTYQYFINKIELIGSEMKVYLKEIDEGDLVIEIWDENGKQNCNTDTYKERCSTAIITTNEKIINEIIKDDTNYSLTYFRDKKGTVESVLITDTII